MLVIQFRMTCLRVKIMRITQKQLENKIVYLNKITGNPEEPWKNVDGKIRLIIPTAIGKTQIFDDISFEQLKLVI